MTDYGTPKTRKGIWRPLIAANHFLHFASSVIVLALAALFISNGQRDRFTIFWIVVACVDTFLFLPSVILPFLKFYKGYLAPISLIFSYLWLTSFIFAALLWNNRSPIYGFAICEEGCHKQLTLQAFTFLAFFTSLVGALLEMRLFDVHRNRGVAPGGEPKHAPVANEGVTA